MAADTFDSMVRQLRLYVPQLPYMLAQQMVRDRYRRILERRGWSGLRSETEYQLKDAKTAGTVTVTFQSTSVTGSGTAFAAGDIGRQFKVGSSPIYTIANVAGQVLTLDRAYGNPTAAGQTYTVFDGYVTAPSDFKSHIAVIDRQSGWRLRTWISQDELNAWDPQRNFFGQAYVIADRRYNAAGLVQFELWPYVTAQRSYHVLYFQTGLDLVNDTDLPIHPIRSDAIVSGALADVCRWPGTPDRPNGYFGKMDIWRSYELETEDKLVEIERADENIYLTWLNTQSFLSYPFVPISANYIQSHAV